jgi:carotenoid cleavage dioxygenase-like enzyme
MSRFIAVSSSLQQRHRAITAVATLPLPLSRTLSLTLPPQTRLGLIKPSAGTANTALQYHAGRLMALHEADAPYALKVRSFSSSC